MTLQYKKTVELIQHQAQAKCLRDRTSPVPLSKQRRHEIYSEAFNSIGKVQLMRTFDEEFLAELLNSDHEKLSFVKFFKNRADLYFSDCGFKFLTYMSKIMIPARSLQHIVPHTKLIDYGVVIANEPQVIKDCFRANRLDRGRDFMVTSDGKNDTSTFWLTPPAFKHILMRARRVNAQAVDPDVYATYLNTVERVYEMYVDYSSRYDAQVIITQDAEIRELKDTIAKLNSINGSMSPDGVDAFPEGDVFHNHADDSSDSNSSRDSVESLVMTYDAACAELCHEMSDASIDLPDMIASNTTPWRLNKTDQYFGATIANQLNRDGLIETVIHTYSGGRDHVMRAMESKLCATYSINGNHPQKVHHKCVIMPVKNVNVCVVECLKTIFMKLRTRRIRTHNAVTGARLSIADIPIKFCGVAMVRYQQNDCFSLSDLLIIMTNILSAESDTAYDEAAVDQLNRVMIKHRSDYEAEVALLNHDGLLQQIDEIASDANLELMSRLA